MDLEWDPCLCFEFAFNLSTTTQSEIPNVNIMVPPLNNLIIFWDFSLF